MSDNNVLSLVGYVYTYIMGLHRFVYVSQCCTEHATSSAWSASQHSHIMGWTSNTVCDIVEKLIDVVTTGKVILMSIYVSESLNQ